MTLDEAFVLSNNLDVREPLRKFSPQWSTIAVGSTGEILAVIRHKDRPSLASNREHLLMYPESIQITAWPGRFSSSDALGKLVVECLETHKTNR